MRDAQALARAVAAYGLAGADPEPPATIEAEAWGVTLLQLRHERLTGIAVAAAEAGWLPLRDDQLDELLDAHRDAMVWCLGIERLLLDVADAFDAEGIGLLVLKGSALARTVYPEPSWRPFVDLDLLVRTMDWRHGVAVLERDFGPRRIPEPRPGFDERFSKGAVFSTARGQIDLHRTLAQGPFGQWIDAERLFDRSEPVLVGERSLRRPDDEGMFVHACVHAILGDERPPLRSLRDVAQLAERVAFDDQAVRVLATGWRVASVLEHASSCAVETLGWGPPAGLDLVAHDTGRRERRAFRAYLGPRSLPAIQAETIRAMPGLGRKIRYVRDLLIPGRTFLRSRRMHERGSYIRRWVSALNWLVPGKAAK